MIFSLLCLCFSNQPPKETVLYTNNDYGSKYWRIPAIVKATDGTLVTATDARWTASHDLPGEITVMIKRSTDNGLTWSEPIQIPNQTSKKGYGDAALVLDKTNGRLFCLINGEQGFFQSTPTDNLRLFSSYSDDNGLTWTPLSDFTDVIYGAKCTTCDEERKNWKGIFITSGIALCLRNGSLMAAANVRHGDNSVHNHVVYSHDHGKSWHITPNSAFKGANEAKIVELNNGTLIMSVRQSKHRNFVYSNDGGWTWGKPIVKYEIVEPSVDGDLIRYTSTKDGYDKDRLIHTISYNQNKRINGTVLISYDEGETWPVKKVFQSGGTGYTTATILDDGRIAVYYERDNAILYDLVVSIFDLEWATDGKDKYTPPKKE